MLSVCERVRVCAIVSASVSASSSVGASASARACGRMCVCVGCSCCLYELPAYWSRCACPASRRACRGQAPAWRARRSLARALGPGWAGPPPAQLRAYILLIHLSFINKIIILLLYEVSCCFAAELGPLLKTRQQQLSQINCRSFERFANFRWPVGGGGKGKHDYRRR